MTTWRRGHKAVLARLGESNPTLDRFTAELAEVAPGRVPGTAVYLSMQEGWVPQPSAINLGHNKVLHEHVLLLRVVTEQGPRVPGRERVSVEPLEHGLSRLIVHYGFTESPNVPEALTAPGVPPCDLDEVTYFVGRVTAVPSGAAVLSPWRDHVFAFMSRNALSAVDVLRPPADRVVELGVRVEL